MSDDFEASNHLVTVTPSGPDQHILKSRKPLNGQRDFIINPEKLYQQNLELGTNWETASATEPLGYVAPSPQVEEEDYFEKLKDLISRIK